MTLHYSQARSRATELQTQLNDVSQQQERLLNLNPLAVSDHGEEGERFFLSGVAGNADILTARTNAPSLAVLDR